MQYLKVMESLQPLDHLDEHRPDFSLSEELALLLVLRNLLIEITIICELHYDAEGVGTLVEEGLFITHDVGVTDGG